MGLESDSLKWHVLRYIADSVCCGICHRSFAPDEVAILSQQDDVWFVSVSCDVCGTESMILVVLQNETDDAGDMIDMLSAGPAERVAHESLGPITEQEMEELHRFLQGYHGNLTEFWDLDDSET